MNSCHSPVTIRGSGEGGACSATLMPEEERGRAAARAGELLGNRAILDYLVLMLTSFTRMDSWSLEVEQGGASSAGGSAI